MTFPGAARVAYRWVRRVAGIASNIVDAPVLVLLYHRVTTLQHDPQRLAVNPLHFRQQLQWLKTRYPVLRFEDDWRRARRPAVVLTFDDGYADNALEALPVIEEVGVPATFFVSAGNVGNRSEFWWDEIERCIEAAPAAAGPPALPSPSGEQLFSEATGAGRPALYEALHRFLKPMPVEAREAALAALRAWARVGQEGRETHRGLSVDELRRLAASPFVTIGAHGIQHAPLSRLGLDAQRAEIEGSRRQVEQWIGRPVRVFAYPFGGRSDYDRDCIALCREGGFTKAAANIPANWHRWHDDFHIPRHLVRDWDGATFAARFGDLLRQ